MADCYVSSSSSTPDLESVTYTLAITATITITTTAPKTGSIDLLDFTRPTDPSTTFTSSSSAVPSQTCSTEQSSTHTPTPSDRAAMKVPILIAALCVCAVLLLVVCFLLFRRQRRRQRPVSMGMPVGGRAELETRAAPCLVWELEAGRDVAELPAGRGPKVRGDGGWGGEGGGCGCG